MSDQTVTLRIRTDAGGTVTAVQGVVAEVDKIGGAAQRAGREAGAGFAQTRTSASTATEVVRNLRQQVLGFFGIAAGAAAIRTVTRLADEYTNLQSRIRLVTDSQAQANAVSAQVFNIAQQTRSELSATGQLYTTLARSTADLGLSQSQLAQITQTANQSFVVSGASADSVRAAIVQLSQGLASGALRGDEFNSVAEQAPILLDLVAESLGKSRGELREFAAQGGITAKILTDALLSGAVNVQRQFDGMQITIAGAGQQVESAAAKFVGGAGQASGASLALASAISLLAGNFDAVATVSVAIGAIYGIRLVAQLGASALAWASNGLQVLAYNASLLRLGATSPLVAGALRGVTVSAVGLSAALGPIALGLTALAVAITAVRSSANSDPLRKQIESLDELNQKLREQARLQRLIDSSRATSASVQSVSDIDQAQRRVDDLNARLERITAGPRSRGTESAIAAIRREIDAATRSTEQYARKLGENAALSGSFDKLPPTMKALAEGTRDAARQLATWVGLGREAAKLPLKPTSDEFNKSLSKQLDTLRGQNIEIKKGVRARIEFEAITDAGVESVDQLSQASRDLIDAVVRETEENKKLKASRKDATSESTKAKEALRAAKEAAAAWREESAAAAADLAGPQAQAVAAYEKQIREMADLVSKGAISVDEFNAAANVQEQVLNRATIAAQAQLSPIDQMLADLRFEATLIGLSNTEREVEIALRQAALSLQQQGIDKDSAEGKSKLALVAASARQNAEQTRLADTAQQAAEEYQSAWRNATDSVSRAFGDRVTGGIDLFKNFGKALKDILRQTLSDLIAMIVRSNVTRMLAGLTPVAANAGTPGANVTGAVTGAVGSGGSLLGGITQGGGLVGNLLGSTFGTLGGTLAGLGGALGGFGAGLTVAGNAGLLAAGQFGVASLAAGNLAVGFGALIPVVGAIVGAAVLVNSLTGGGLFGTKFKTVSSGIDFTIGDSGASGFEFQNQTKKKALFGGKKKRTLTSALDEDAQQAIDDLFAQLTQSLAEAAKTLGVEVPTLISGSFRQEFDKKGNLGKEFSTIAGRVYNESQQAFAQRLQAENIVALVDSALNLDELGSAQDEASQIAERWRGSAERLLAGAQFLLLATTDLRNGFNLLGTGTLTGITALIEDLAKAGEPLAQAYARVSVSTQLLEQALDLSGVTLTKTRDEFVRFAVDIADAAGGLDRAQALWSDYFTRFFSETERAQLALNDALANAATQFTDINLDATAFTGDGGAEAFRALFEQALPTLSAEAVVEWLEAANALGLVLDATSALNDSLDATATAADEAAALAEQLAGFMDSITDQARDAADALADFGLSDLAVGLAQVARETGRAIDAATALGATESDFAEIRDLGAARAELIQRQALANLAILLDGVSQSLFDLDVSPLEIELARIQRAMSDTLAQASALGATEAELARIRELGARQAEQAAAAQRAQLTDLLGGVSQSLFELDASPLEIELARIQTAMQATLDQASALGATEAELARIRELGARQSAAVIETEVQRLRDAFVQLAQSIGQTRQSIADDILSIRRPQLGFSESGFQSGRIDDLRIQLDGAVDPQERIGLIDQIRQATLARFNAELAAIQQTDQAQQQASQAAQQAIAAQREALLRLRDFADGLGLSSNSPLTASQRLDVARSQFDNLLGRARGGDTDAIGSLQQAADALLSENRTVFGVSQIAVDEFNRVQQELRSIAGQGVRGVASFNDPFQRASIDTASRIAQLQADAIGELQSLDDTLAALRLTQEAQTEGSVDALRARFDQAEVHKDEIVAHILPIVDAISQSKATGDQQLAEARRQTEALQAVLIGIDGQQTATGAFLDKFLVWMGQQKDQVDQQQAEIERMARAIETAVKAVRA
jgi:tape measure domain-containing protein